VYRRLWCGALAIVACAAMVYYAVGVGFARGSAGRAALVLETRLARTGTAGALTVYGACSVAWNTRWLALTDTVRTVVAIRVDALRVVVAQLSTSGTASSGNTQAANGRLVAVQADLTVRQTLRAVVYTYIVDALITTGYQALAAVGALTAAKSGTSVCDVVTCCTVTGLVAIGID